MGEGRVVVGEIEAPVGAALGVGGAGCGVGVGRGERATEGGVGGGERRREEAKRLEEARGGERRREQVGEGERRWGVRGGGKHLEVVHCTPAHGLKVLVTQVSIQGQARNLVAISEARAVLGGPVGVWSRRI